MYVVCSEHIDRAIDDFLEEYESPPDVHVLAELSFSNWNAPEECQFCEHAPCFLVV